MTTPTGTISMTDIQTEFGGANPISLSEYYAGGAYVPSGLAGVPSSGTISMDNLRGKTKTAAPTPTYSVSSSATSVDEGSSVTFTISTTNFTGSTLYYSLDAVSGLFNSVDVSSGSLTGSVTIASGSGSVTVTLYSDGTTESTVESFRFNLKTGSTSGTTVASSAVITVNDTSQASDPASPTYSVSASITSVDEGGVVTFTITTTNLPSATLYYTLDAVSNAFDSSDLTLVSAPISGSVAISNSTGSVGVHLKSDQLTEGIESFKLNLRTGSETGPVVATSATVSINDTSVTPATEPATYDSLVFDPAVINEGQTSRWTLTTSNVPNGTVLYCNTSSLANTVDVSADFVGLASQFTVTVNNNAAEGTITAAYDTLVEDQEYFLMNLRSGSYSGAIVKSATLKVNQALGTINTLTLSITGGGQNQATAVYLQISSIAAYPAARTFDITRQINGGAKTNAGLIATQITVAANQIFSPQVKIYQGSGVDFVSSLSCFLNWSGAYIEKQSNTLTNIWM